MFTMSCSIKTAASKESKYFNNFFVKNIEQSSIDSEEWFLIEQPIVVSKNSS